MNKLTPQKTLITGMGLGTLLALGCTEWVVMWLGWRWVFWGSGILALVWAPLWFILVRNDPQQHPFISDREKKLLLVVEVQPKVSTYTCI